MTEGPVTYTRRVCRRVGVVVILAVAATTLFAAPALAGSAGFANGTLTFTASTGESNQLEIIYNAPTIIVFDQSPIAHEPGCTTPDGSIQTFVHCTTDVPVPKLVAGFGDGDDTLAIRTGGGRTWGTSNVDLGPGNDQVPGFYTAAVVAGGTGNDRISGSREGDRLDGGPGNDFLMGEAGSDFLIGGAGADRMNMRSGSGGSFVGGPGPDFIVTGPGRALLVDAGSGDDRVWGGSRHLPGPRTVTLPARSVRPLLCGLGHDRVKVARGQAVRSCEGRLR